MKKTPTHLCDARGRRVSQLDPVQQHLLNQSAIIPEAALRSIVDDLLPGARRQRLIMACCSASSVIVIVGGPFVYFRYFSTWKGFDPVNVTIYFIQAAVIIAAPVLVFRMARLKYLSRVASVMLLHRRCPHCGYDLHGLDPDKTDACTVCPECGCAWTLDGDDSNRE